MRSTWGVRRGGAVAVAALLLAVVAGAPATAQTTYPPSPAPATPKAECGPGSRPETGRQGRVSLEDHQSGRAAEGFTCNTELVGRIGATGGYKVERYVDAAGHECAYYDSTLLFPKDAAAAGIELTGVHVLDMSNPAKPVKTANLLTPAMQTPHESLSLNQTRGLLAAVTANPLFYPGVVDIYDVTQDCRAPVLQSSLGFGVLGHESGWAPDGRTFYVASLDGGTLTAVDTTNPRLPVPLWTTTDYHSHSLSISDDGNRAYLADRTGLVILDVSEINARKPNPKHVEVSRLTWPTLSTPQNTIPITIKGHPFLIEMDEFGTTGPHIGAARIIDIADERNPTVISDIRLEVHQNEHRPSQSADPGNTGPGARLQGYAGHYCNVATRVDPDVVACTFIVSGLRLFDIRDPYAPREIAYFNAPPGTTSTHPEPSNYAMASPTIVPERGEIWYSDGNSGFYAVRVTNGVWPFRRAAAAPPRAQAPAVARPQRPHGGTLPATGTTTPPWVPVGVVGSAVLAFLARRVGRRPGA